MAAFDAIRPYSDAEVAAVLQRLLADPAFQDILARYRFPRLAKPLGWLLRPILAFYLRRELADTHVRVLYFAPRTTRTSMNAPSVVAMNDELGVAMDAPEKVAAELLQAIRHEQEERYLGWPERLFVRLNGLLPRVVDQALRKQLPIIQRFARHKH